MYEDRKNIRRTCLLFRAGIDLIGKSIYRDNMKFLPEEILLMTLVPVKILMYVGWGLPSTYYWTKGIMVTNKRIIVSFQWFGYESFFGGYSYYYNERE